MSATPPFWIPTVRPPLDGEPVNQQIVGRPINQLAQRDAFLYNQLRDLALASGRVVRAQAPVVTGTAAGSVVYWDTAEEAWAPALATVDYDPATGSLVAAKSSFSSGLLLTSNGDTGDVLVFGCVSPTANDLPGVSLDGMLDTAGDTFVDGVYYLSRKVAGKITRVPSFPRVQLGHFTSGLFVFAPRFDGLPGGHVHHEFALSAKPAASQNYGQTGWATIGGQKAVDYFNGGVDATPPPFKMSIRRNGTELPTATRVEIYNSGGLMGVQIHAGAGIGSPTVPAGSPTTLTPAAWPVWGQWVTIPNTGIDISFCGVNEATTLASQVPTNLDTSNKRFRIFLPTDVDGWTNANVHDAGVPSAAKFTYVWAAPNVAWPPRPLESTRIELNGVGTLYGIDFQPTAEGLHWLKTDALAPWPVDYVLGGTPADPITLRLAFAALVGDTGDQFVTSLVSGSPSLRIERCTAPVEASTGDLRIFLNLALGIQEEITEGSDTTIVGAEGESLLRGPLVSELEAGAGIAIERLDGSAERASLPGRKVGKLRISRQDAVLGGEFSTVALRNAKEIVKSGLSYIYFLKPSVAPTGIDARFRVPFAGLAEPNTLKVRSLFMGATSIAMEDPATQAIFKAVYRVVRRGTDLDTVTATDPSYWVIPFPAGYSANKVLDAEFPAVPEIDLGNIILQDGDIVTLDLSRISSGNGNTDTYVGDVACVSLAWQITT